jgi:predicted PurR-regulated permease PerM
LLSLFFVSFLLETIFELFTIVIFSIFFSFILNDVVVLLDDFVKPVFSSKVILIIFIFSYAPIILFISFTLINELLQPFYLINLNIIF